MIGQIIAEITLVVIPNHINCGSENIRSPTNPHNIIITEIVKYKYNIVKLFLHYKIVLKYIIYFGQCQL